MRMDEYYAMQVREIAFRQALADAAKREDDAVRDTYVRNDAPLDA